MKKQEILNPEIDDEISQNEGLIFDKKMKDSDSISKFSLNT